VALLESGASRQRGSVRGPDSGAGRTLWRSRLAAIAWIHRAALGLLGGWKKAHEGLDQREHGEHGYMFDASASRFPPLLP
jgi:hypothetical protein